ncbi:MAG: mevalonate kinase family protein [Bdellovibrionota bacterium]
MIDSLSVHGKCILIGEHSVVRGAPALVFPLKSRELSLSWQRKEGEGVEISANDYTEAFLGALNLALEKSGSTLPKGLWKFAIKSQIPVRAGLGSSAALSVAIVRFLEQIGLHSGDPFPLALELENIFHGRSSGIDVAAVLRNQPILFRRNQPAETLELAWKPALYLFDTGLRSSTKDCVEQVTKIARPELDSVMEAEVLNAKAALQDSAGFQKLARAINASATIFREWRLIPFSVESQMKTLESAGASAVKPTGSGNGGYLLSLWNRKPESALGLIPLSADS